MTRQTLCGLPSTPPCPIELTEKEARLFKNIKEITQSPAENTVRGDSMEALMVSLQKRKAIPEARLRVFCDPEYAEKGNCSIKETFEAKGHDERGIVRHGNFVKFLNYFINGPKLPEAAISGLYQILKEDRGTSGMLLNEYCTFARTCVRRFNLDTHTAATEFFRLGVELGMDASDARSLRKAALSTK